MSNPKVSREEKAQITMNWLAPVQQGGGKPRTHEDLARDFHEATGRRISPKAVAQAIRDAFQECLVSITRNPTPPEYGLDLDLSRMLRERFPPLRAAIVVDSKADATDDEAHMQAGDALAKHILSQMPFRDGDRIGIGSGRGVYYAVEALRVSGTSLIPAPGGGLSELARSGPANPDREQGVVIMSLMGSMFPYSTHKQQEILFDSDITVARFAQCFDSLVHVRPVSYPIALPAGDKPDIIQRTWLGSRNYHMMLPTHCIIGMGILNAHHRFYKAVRPGHKTPTILDPIHTKLVTLLGHIDDLSLKYPDYCPVADVCGRMFLVPPPSRIRPQDQTLIKTGVEPLIEQLNSQHLLTVTKTQLGHVTQSVMLIAPTKQKAPGLHLLLTHPHLRVGVVVTNTAGASALLKMKRPSRAAKKR
jgi:hypothetical protein